MSEARSKLIAKNLVSEWRSIKSIRTTDLEPSDKWQSGTEILDRRLQVMIAEALGEEMRTFEEGWAECEKEMAREITQLQVQLDAWQKAFGTTQLTHAIARLERAESLLNEKK